ncbi:GNAT family N-acetyltransferase [Peribacillus sp. NPDC097675]|uniref:GNAT family N-acetyltransferase n=1 Tax=Peribacillus sp. NPDC097675 TaxID=3390618 RepID=UPI003D063234
MHPSIEFTITKATIEDMEQIISLRLALLTELDEIKSSEEKYLMEKSTREYLQKALSNNEFISYVAKTDGKAVSISGMVLFNRPPYLENLKGIEAYILNMYTLPEYRGNGLARRILEHCIKESEKYNVKRIWLHSSKSGKHLYDKMGFTEKGSEMELFL